MLSLSDISALKREVESRFEVKLHFHDVCPKPYFTLETRNEAVESFISDFLENRNYYPEFSENYLQFTVEKIV